MTLEELESWMTDNEIHKGINDQYGTEYFFVVFLLLFLKKYYGNNELTIHKLIMFDDEIISTTAMCKKLSEFDINDLNYYFDSYKKQIKFFSVYTKKQKIYKKKQDLSKDFL